MCIYEYSTLSMHRPIWSFTSKPAPVWTSMWAGGLGYASSEKGHSFKLEIAQNSNIQTPS